MHEVYINGKKYIEEVKIHSSTNILEQVLDTPIEYELGKGTIRDYLRNLLLKLWEEDESFDGKRPFGNSCWYLDLFLALAENNLLGEVTIDQWDEVHLTREQKTQAYTLIQDAINYLFTSN